MTTQMYSTVTFEVRRETRATLIPAFQGSLADWQRLPRPSTKCNVLTGRAK